MFWCGGRPLPPAPLMEAGGKRVRLGDAIRQPVGDGIDEPVIAQVAKMLAARGFGHDDFPSVYLREDANRAGAQIATSNYADPVVYQTPNNSSQSRQKAQKAKLDMACRAGSWDEGKAAYKTTMDAEQAKGRDAVCEVQIAYHTNMSDVRPRSNVRSIGILARKGGERITQMAPSFSFLRKPTPGIDTGNAFKALRAMVPLVDEASLWQHRAALLPQENRSDCSGALLRPLQVLLAFASVKTLEKMGASHCVQRVRPDMNHVIGTYASYPFMASSTAPSAMLRIAASACPPVIGSPRTRCAPGLLCTAKSKHMWSLTS